MTGTARRFARLTYPEAEAAAKRGASVILPFGSVEPHGPHLPLETDLIIAQAMAEAAARQCEEAGTECYVLPPLTYAVTEFARGFGGGVSIHENTAASILIDVCRSLIEQGFRKIAVANAHLEPGHLQSIRQAIKKIQESTGVEILFPDITSRRWGRMLTDEFKSGACHAGQFETSLIMYCAPESVNESMRTELAANPVSLSEKINEGVKSFKDAGGNQAYFGYPAQATREEGEATLKILASMLVSVLQESSSD
jgi:creatinine amidohydrolase